MTARDLIKMLECFDLDKKVAIIVSVISETSEGYGVMLKDVEAVIENEDIIALE